MQNIILNFIEKVSNKKEFKLFYDYFTNIPPTQFAVIKISGETLNQHIEQIASDIAFLNKLNIYPVIVHGAGSKLDELLPNSKKSNGIRITEKDDMIIIKDAFEAISDSLVEKINSYGGCAARVQNLFDCEQINQYGYVGKIKKVNINKIEEIINQNKTPIISPLGICDEQYLNINADTAATEVINAILPNKIIILTETGGILDKDGNIISFLNPHLEDDLSNITGGMLLKIKEITTLLDNHPESSVVITSATNLLKEIFTVKGSGTFIKSYIIKDSKNLDDVEVPKLKSLLENAFDKKLVENYFQTDILEILYESNYEGVAILKNIDGIPYLDKFAVAKHRQETGLGSSIWNKLIKKYSKFVLRVTPKNPMNSFYAKHCSGFMKHQNWNVYWINLEKDEILKTVEKVVQLEKTIA